MLLIDAYNVLHMPMPPALAGLETAELCQALARTRWRYRGVVVVCDGQVGPLGLVESPVDEVELVYSGVTRTADEVIIDRVTSTSAPRRLIVVSSDHEIRKAARRRGAVSWTSEQFLHELVEALRQGPGVGGPEKPAADGLTDQQVADWLEAFGYSGEEPNPTADDAPAAPAGDEDDGRHWPPW